MRKIRIVDVLLQNFRSFSLGSFEITPTTGLKFLGGENTLEPRLGANGAGKTSVWEAVVWCLYGKSIRGARTSGVLSWGQKEVAVSVQIEINGVLHCITRTGPPERIEISTLNSDHCTQSQVDDLLGLSRERFLHAVVFGQGRPLFPDLSVSERGELFDEVLNLDVWTRCSDVASSRGKQIAETLSGLSNSLHYLSGQISSIPSEESFHEKIVSWEANREKRVAELLLATTNWWNQLREEIDGIERQSESWEENQKASIESIQKQVSDWERKAADALEILGVEIEDGQKQVLEVRKLFPAPQNEDELTALQAELREKEALQQAVVGKQARLLAERQIRETECDQLQMLAVCPTCKQNLPMGDRPQHIARLRKDIFDIDKMLAEAASQISESANVVSLLREKHTKLLVAKNTRNSTLRNLENEIRVLEMAIRKYELEAERIVKELENGSSPYHLQLAEVKGAKSPYPELLSAVKARTCPYDSQIAGLKQEQNPYLSQQAAAREQRAALERTKGEKEREFQQVQGELTAVEYWKTGFKRIRLYFVNQILEALQIEIASAINSLGLSGWSVKLSTESETKAGTVKLGVQIRIRSASGDEGDWETWSGGEAQRLRLAMGMGLAALIQRAAGVWFDVEVWDEPSAWLSELGIEDLLEALRYRADSHRKQVWLVDHRALTYSGFREIWCVRKGAEGSQVVKVSEAAS